MALTDQLTSFTRKNFIPTVVDNVYASNALFVRLKSRMIPLDGGTSIEVPVLYTKRVAQNFSGYDVLTVAPVEQATVATFNWAFYAIDVTLSGTDDLKNSGKWALVNNLKINIQNAEKGLKDSMGTDLFGTGSASNSIVGLQAAVDDGTNTATYGSINRTTSTWWKAQYAANGGAARPLTMYTLQNMMGKCTIDNDRPSMLVSTQVMFDKYFLLSSPKQIFMDSDLARNGFTNLTFNGRPFVVDSHVPTISSLHQVFYLNENYLKFYYHKDANFLMRPFMQPFNQWVIGSFIVWAGQLITDNSRMHGRMVDFDPTL